MHLYFQGIPTCIPPSWVIVLEAADQDPLRAQEIEDKIGQRWWFYYRAYREALAKYQRMLKRK